MEKKKIFNINVMVWKCLYCVGRASHNIRNIPWEDFQKTTVNKMGEAGNI